MDIDELNKIFSSLSNISLSPLNEDGISSTQLKNGTVLEIFAASKTLMLFMEVENLGNAGSESPDIFRLLLSINTLGGRFGNLRITYDEESTSVWVCYDISYEELTVQLLEEKLSKFIEEAPQFANMVREEIIYTYINEPKDSEPAHEDSIADKLLHI